MGKRVIRGGGVAEAPTLRSLVSGRGPIYTGPPCIPDPAPSFHQVQTALLPWVSPQASHIWINCFFVNKIPTFS